MIDNNKERSVARKLTLVCLVLFSITAALQLFIFIGCPSTLNLVSLSLQVLMVILLAVLYYMHVTSSPINNNDDNDMN